MLYLWCLIFVPKITYNTQTWKLDFRVCWQGDMVQKKLCFIHMSNVLNLPWKKLTDLPCQNIASDIFQYERKTCHTLFFFCYFSPKTHFLRYSMYVNGWPCTIQFSRIQKFFQLVQLLLKTSSPNYSQTDKLSKMGVKIVKRIFKECWDPHIGLLQYHNTPITGVSYTPSQLLMSQSSWSILLVNNSILKPSIPNNVKNEILLKNKKINLITIKQQNHYHPSNQ